MHNSMYVCPQCKTENKPAANYCRRCGQARPVRQPATLDYLSRAAEKPAVNAARQAETGPDTNYSLQGSNKQAAGAADPDESAGKGTACLACNTPIRLLDKFCLWCGDKQPERAGTRMKHCPGCSTQLPVKADFCFVCGNATLRRPGTRVPGNLFLEEDPELFPTFES